MAEDSITNEETLNFYATISLYIVSITIFKFSQKKQKNMKKDIDKNLTPQITKRVETTENLQTKLTLQD